MKGHFAAGFTFSAPSSAPVNMPDRFENPWQKDDEDVFIFSGE
jgi:hypothetical protein